MTRTVWRTLRLVTALVVQRPFPGFARYAHRLLVGSLFLAALLALQSLHLIGFALDRLLSGGYRRVAVRAPVFVLGTPRSGTTFLHRVLADDPRFTTLSTWECLLAPSVTERRVVLALSGVDRALGRPLGRCVHAIERRLAPTLDALHPTTLGAPEEDYFTELPWLACFALVVPFPEARWLWRGARLDERPAAERAAFGRRYRRALQRHLYVHGEHRTMLSKNAAWAGSARTLIDTFPDARLLVCRRDPLRALDSQLRVLDPAFAVFGVDPEASGARSAFVDAFVHWNASLETLLEAGRPGVVRVPLAQLSRHTHAVVSDLYPSLGLDMPDTVSTRLREREREALAHVPSTPYAAPGAPSTDPATVARFACRPERRVLVLSDAAPERNGVGSYYEDLVHALARHDTRIELLHPGHATFGGFARWSLPLPGDPTQRLMVPPLRSITGHVAEIAPDAIVVPTPGPYGMAGLALARRFDVPLVVGFHTDYEALAGLYWRGPFGALCRACLGRVNRLLFRHAAKVLANSPETARQAAALGARDVEVMGTPVAGPFLDTPPVPARERLTRVLFAGRLASEKNVPALIRLAEARPGLDVVVAGDGPLRATLERAATRLPNLRLEGWVSRERLVALIDGCDAFVLPSVVESFGTVALEAMARGRPVLVSGGCGIAAWPELAGALVTLHPDETLESGVGRLAALDAATRHALGDRARRAAHRLDDDNARDWAVRLERLARSRREAARPGDVPPREDRGVSPIARPRRPAPVR